MTTAGTSRSLIDRTRASFPSTRRTPTRSSRRSSRCAAGGRAERPRRPHRRRRLRGLERVRRAVLDPDRRAARSERSQVQPLPHDGALLADATSPAHRTEPPCGRDGRDHRDRDLGAGLQLDPPEHVRSAGRDPEAERLRDRAVRQVPRGAGLGDQSDGAVPGLADRLGIRALLRLHRRRDEPVRAGDLPRHGPGRAGRRRRRRATTSRRT